MILSAKFGVRGAVGEEVADVTVALAALIGDDSVKIDEDDDDDGEWEEKEGIGKKGEGDGEGEDEDEDGGGGNGGGVGKGGRGQGGHGGRLVIPAGVRKGRLLGFWDPAPGRRKMLCVGYLWRGREEVVEVVGREELRLP